MKNYKVVRTYQSLYKEKENIEELEDLLNKGYEIINKTFVKESEHTIAYIEYILEKEV